MRQRIRPLVFGTLAMAVGLWSVSVSAQNQPSSPPASRSNTKTSEDKPSTTSTKKAEVPADKKPETKKVETEQSPSASDKKRDSNSRAKKSKRFVDRNGDGIQDGMEHRFRRTYCKNAEARGERGDRFLRRRRGNQHRYGAPSQNSGKGQ